MKSDVNGCSTTKPGKEHYEEFWSDAKSKTFIQYDYRHTNGELFSCVKERIEDCRTARDSWLMRKGY